VLTCRVTGPMFESIGWGTYAFFAAMNIVIIFPTVWYLFPETKQRSLEDVSVGSRYPMLTCSWTWCSPLQTLKVEAPSKFPPMAIYPRQARWKPSRFLDELQLSRPEGVTMPDPRFRGRRVTSIPGPRTPTTLRTPLEATVYMLRSTYHSCS